MEKIFLEKIIDETHAIQKHVKFATYEALDEEKYVIKFFTLNPNNKASTISATEYAQSMKSNRAVAEYVAHVANEILNSPVFEFPSFTMNTKKLEFTVFYHRLVFHLFSISKRNVPKNVIRHALNAHNRILEIMIDIEQYCLSGEYIDVFGKWGKHQNIEHKLCEFVSSLWENLDFERFVILHEESKQYNFSTFETWLDPKKFHYSARISDLLDVTFDKAVKSSNEENNDEELIDVVTDELVSFITQIVERFGEDFSKGTIISDTPLSCILTVYAIYFPMNDDEIMKRDIDKLFNIPGFKDLVKKQIETQPQFSIELLQNRKGMKESMINYICKIIYQE